MAKRTESPNPSRRAVMLAGLAAPAVARAAVNRHAGGKELPHERYIHVVSLKDSPVEQVYIKSKDGLYIAAAIRKPKGAGPHPALIYFHGAPGGRGMEKLVSWAEGSTGSPVWERFLQEGCVVVVADYRHPGQNLLAPFSAGVSYVDDGNSVLEFVRALPYVDGKRVALYGVSLGGNLVAHLIGRADVSAAVLGAPATVNFLTSSPLQITAATPPEDRFKNFAADPAVARRNAAAVRCPVLILAGTADSLLPVDQALYDALAGAGKTVQMEIYEGGYHDFCIGPQGHPGRSEPLLEGTLDALERTLEFLRRHGAAPEKR